MCVSMLKWEGVSVNWVSKTRGVRSHSLARSYGTWHNNVTVHGRTYAHRSNLAYSHIRPCVHSYVTHRKHTPVRKIT